MINTVLLLEAVVGGKRVRGVVFGFNFLARDVAVVGSIPTRRRNYFNFPLCQNGNGNYTELSFATQHVMYGIGKPEKEMF